MKKRVILVVLIQLCLISAFLYFEFINRNTRYCDIAKYGVIIMSFLTSLMFFRRSWSRRDAVLLSLGLFLTVVLDYFLVLAPPTEDAFIIGMTIYCVVHSVYFFRFNSFKMFFIPLLFAVIPFALRAFWDLPMLICVSAFYAQILAADLISAVLALKKGKLPRVNGVMILVSLVIFIAGDIVVILTNAALIRVFRKLIWVFYAPSQALLSLSAAEYNNKDIHSPPK